MCKIFERLKTKDSMEMVVRINCGRGGPIPSRLGVVVDRPESSCLGFVAEMGMEDRDSDSENWGKRRLYDQNGRIWVV